MTSSPPEDRPLHFSKERLLAVLGPQGSSVDAEAPPEAVATGEDSSKSIGYGDHTVAFIDILGFKEHIKASEKDPDLVTKIHDALSFDQTPSFSPADEFARRLDLDPDTLKDITHSFSDCIAISTGTSPEEIGLLVYIVFQKSRELLLKGFISRGGISMGKLYHDPKLLFGPAFNHAYLLESTNADGARIILGNPVRKAIDQYCQDHPATELTGFLKSHILRAEDGPALIDLFADVKPAAFYRGLCTPEDDIKAIRQVICSALDAATDSPHIFRKIASLAHAFNTALRANQRYWSYFINDETLPGAAWSA